MFGFLKKKKQDEREKFERITSAIYEAFGVTTELRENNDNGPLLSAGDYESDLQLLSGTQVKVSLVRAANGIRMIKEDGKPVEDRRSLTQENLAKVPNDVDELYFVNLNTPSGEIYSCIIAQPDAQVFGSMRAFWWSLARMNVQGLSDRLNRTKMTEKSFARVFMSARTMWEIVVEESKSIDNLRDQLVPIRNVHLDVISQMKDKAEGESDKLGFDVALAMVLATQSEDPKLEEIAFNRFKHFLWQPGEEPKEFYHHSAA